MGGARAAVNVSRLECLKLEWTRGKLGTRTLSSSSSSSSSSSPSSSSSLIIPHPARDHSARRLQLSAAVCSHLDPAVRVRLMDPAVLIFLLYVMIAHELVCGWMQYRRQSNKPRKAAATPLLRSSARVCQAAWRTSSQSIRTDRGRRDLRKSGRIVRKA